MRELPFERSAMRNEPMPEELDLTDQIMYQGLAQLYGRFYAGFITREAAKKEKGQMLFEYDKRKAECVSEREAYNRIAELFKRIELASTEFSKTQTVETANQLYYAIYNIWPKRKEGEDS